MKPNKKALIPFFVFLGIFIFLNTMFHGAEDTIKDNFPLFAVFCNDRRILYFSQKKAGKNELMSLLTDQRNQLLFTCATSSC